MVNHLRVAAVMAFLFCLLLVPQSVRTQALPDVDVLGIEYGSEAGLTRNDPRITVARIIQVALGLLGTIALVLVIYAGFKWMTAAGNEDAATEAKSIIFSSVIGLAIILSAYSITTFIVRQLYTATTRAQYPGVPQ